MIIKPGKKKPKDLIFSMVFKSYLKTQIYERLKIFEPAMAREGSSGGDSRKLVTSW